MIDVDALRPGPPWAANRAPTARRSIAHLRWAIVNIGRRRRVPNPIPRGNVFAPPSTDMTSRRKGCSAITRTTVSIAPRSSPPSFSGESSFAGTPTLGPAQTSACRADALAAQVIERLVDASDGDDFHALNTLLGFVGRRDDRALESKLRGFPQPLLTALHGPDFTRQADFAKHKRFT